MELIYGKARRKATTALVLLGKLSHYPSKRGGLNCRDLSSWNKACMIKLIWLLFCNAGSLWVAWYTKEVLNGQKSNFWTCRENQKHSWLANKLIRLRSTVYQCIKVQVGNGATTKFWTDNWSPYGCLEDILQPTISRRMGIPATATLQEISSNGNWNIQSPRNDNQVLVQTYLSTLVLTDTEDSSTWTVDGVVWDKYKTGVIYGLLKLRSQPVSWHGIVWTNGGIPKHNFLVWLFTLNRCPTRDRLLNWGLTVDPKCLLCNVADEPRDHLLFRFNYSWHVWSVTAARCQLQATREWEDTVTTRFRSLDPN